jgi:hypothetical protein
MLVLVGLSSSMKSLLAVTGVKRLHITHDERSIVLEYIAEQKMVVVSIQAVETAINTLLGWERFIEP